MSYGWRSTSVLVGGASIGTVSWICQLWTPASPSRSTTFSGIVSRLICLVATLMPASQRPQRIERGVVGPLTPQASMRLALAIDRDADPWASFLRRALSGVSPRPPVVATARMPWSRMARMIVVQSSRRYASPPMIATSRVPMPASWRTDRRIPPWRARRAARVRRASHSDGRRVTATSPPHREERLEPAIRLARRGERQVPPLRRAGSGGPSRMGSAWRGRGARIAARSEASSGSFISSSSRAQVRSGSASVRRARSRSGCPGSAKDFSSSLMRRTYCCFTWNGRNALFRSRS